MPFALRVVGPIAITYLLTWGVLFAGLYWRVPNPFLGVAVMWAPGVVALIAAKLQKIRLPIVGRPVRHYFTAPLWAILLGFGAFLLTLPFSPLAGVARWNATMHSLGLPLEGFAAILVGLLFFTLLSYIAGITINALAGLGEELMWRGLLWEQLKGLGFLPASLTIGIIWGVWHLPSVWMLGVLYPGVPLWVGSLMIFLLCVALSPILCYLRARGDAIWVPAAFHGSINAIATLAALLFVNPNSLFVGLSGLPGIVVATGVSLYIILKCRKREQPR